MVEKEQRRKSFASIISKRNLQKNRLSVLRQAADYPSGFPTEHTMRDIILKKYGLVHMPTIPDRGCTGSFSSAGKLQNRRIFTSLFKEAWDEYFKLGGRCCWLLRVWMKHKLDENS
ncbi:MAG: hypothetical protein AB1426_04275 [Bacillota bacterium]